MLRLSFDALIDTGEQQPNGVRTENVAGDETLPLRRDCSHVRDLRQLRHRGKDDCEHGRFVKSLAALNFTKMLIGGGRGNLPGGKPVCAVAQSLPLSVATALQLLQLLEALG
jgi:hypothetical protein